MSHVKKFALEIESYNAQGEVTKKKFQADSHEKLATLAITYMPGRQFIRSVTTNQETGEVIDEASQANVNATIHHQLYESGFSPKETQNYLDEAELMAASASNEELIAVAHLSIEKYKKTKDIACCAAVMVTQMDLKRRGVKDPIIDAFMKKNSFLKVMLKAVEKTALPWKTDNVL